MAIIIAILIALGIVSSPDQVTTQVIQKNKSLIIEQAEINGEDVLEII